MLLVSLDRPTKPCRYVANLSARKAFSPCLGIPCEPARIQGYNFDTSCICCKSAFLQKASGWSDLKRCAKGIGRALVLGPPTNHEMHGHAGLCGYAPPAHEGMSTYNSPACPGLCIYPGSAVQRELMRAKLTAQPKKRTPCCFLHFRISLQGMFRAIPTILLQVIQEGCGGRGPEAYPGAPSLVLLQQLAFAQIKSSGLFLNLLRGL